MKELIIKIENKLQSQVDHIFKFYEDNEMKQKMYDLAFEWYIKGLHAGIEVERNDQQRKKERVYIVTEKVDRTNHGVFAQEKDAQDMIESFGNYRSLYEVEEYKLIK